jgi:AraC-like DNA-binding protein
MVVTLRLTVALLATLLACGIGVNAWRQRSFGLACLALWMAALGISAWQLVLVAFQSRGFTPGGWLLFNLLLTLAAPLLLGYVTYAVRGVRLHWAWFLPFAIQVAGSIVLGARMTSGRNALALVPLEIFYTAVAWVVWFRHARPRASQPAVVGVLTAVSAVHVAQVLGILGLLGYIHYWQIRQTPLFVLSAWLAAAVVISLTDSARFRRLAPALTPPVHDDERALFARIEHLMQDARPWSDPDFDVGAMARMLGTYPSAVSRALGRAGNTAFYDYVNEHRVREAQRLLTDPVESRFKVEALGRQAGFRARSTFFKLFRQHTGVTPAEYRASHASARDVPSSPPAC